MPPIGHIVAAVDLEDSAARVIGPARAVARRHGARLTVITVLPSLAHVYSGLDLALEAGFEEGLVHEAKARLRNVSRAGGSLRAVSGTVEVLIGAPVPEITAYARRHQADLVVVGTHAQGGLNPFLSTTATGVLHHCPCDILVTPLAGAHLPYERVLAAIDGTDASAAVLERAADLASQAAVAVVMSGGNPAETRSLVNLLASRAGLTGDVIAVSGKASRQIIRNARAQGAALIVMGSGEHTGMGWLIGSTTNNVLQAPPCDVWVVRTATEPSSPHPR